MSLSQAAIKTAKPGDILRDEKIAGLQLRVFANRSSFYLWYRIHGQERRPKVGDYPSMSLTDAREIAQGWLIKVAMGEDPSATRQMDREAPLMRKLCERYLEKHAVTKAARSAYEDKRYINSFILPKLGTMRVVDIDIVHIEDVLDGMAKTPTQANRCRSLLSKMMKLAERWKMRPLGSNPVVVVSRNPERKRKRYMTREEAVAVLDRVRFYEAEYPRQCAFLMLSVYTGARPIEIAAWKREHRQGDRIVLTEHKTAHSTGEDRVIHLPPQAVAILDKIAELPKQGDELVGVKSCRSLWEKIMEDTGIKKLRRYDLRHTFASIGLSSGMSLAQIGELLGHKSTETTKRYAHLIDEQAAADAAKVASAFDAFARPKLKVVS